MRLSGTGGLHPRLREYVELTLSELLLDFISKFETWISNLDIQVSYPSFETWMSNLDM